MTSLGRTRACSLRTAAWAVVISVLVTAPLAAQVCLGGTEESPGWVAVAYGRANQTANVMGADIGWQLSRTLTVFGDGGVTAYPSPDPRRDRMALGVAYTMMRSRHFAACLTPGIEGERIGDQRVVRVPVGVSLGWGTTFATGQRRLGFRVEPFFVYSRETIARFSRTSRFVSGRAAVVFGIRRLLLGLEQEEDFDTDARWNTRARVGFAFK